MLSLSSSACSLVVSSSASRRLIHSLKPISILILINDLSGDLPLTLSSLTHLLRLPHQSRQRVEVILLSDLPSPLQTETRLPHLLLLLARQIHAREIALLERIPLPQLAVQRQVARAAHVDRLGPVAQLVAQLAHELVVRHSFTQLLATTLVALGIYPPVSTQSLPFSE